MTNRQQRLIPLNAFLMASGYPREQQILLLHIMDKLRFSDITILLGTTEGAAQKAYRRTITRLRGRLEDAEADSRISSLLEAI